MQKKKLIIEHARIQLNGPISAPFFHIDTVYSAVLSKGFFQCKTLVHT